MRKRKLIQSIDAEGFNENQVMNNHYEVTDEQLLMGEAIEHLQGRQRDVYFLTMRQGLSYAETAKLLSISKSAVQIYHDRAVKFITKYCQLVLRKTNE